MVAPALPEAQSLAQVHELAKGKQLALLHFWANWCEPCKQMDVVLQQLVAEHGQQVVAIRVEAEVVDEASVQYAIVSVPTVVLVQGATGKEVSRVEGADPAALTTALDTALRAHSGAASTATAAAAPATADPAQTGGSVEGRIKYLLAQHPVCVFMKGSAAAPRCGFSSRVVTVLQQLQVPFHTVDILSDEPLRQGLKAFSNWPTYPQLYVCGELVGGCDIIEAMHGSGELQQLLVAKLGPGYTRGTATATATAAPAPSSAPAPAAPPAPVSREALTARLQALVSQQPVMLFMKGSPAEPRCGFSRKVASALQSCGVSFGHFDILSDDAVRQGLKEFSNWPTYPQLYAGGELVGGCDIVLELQASGELESTIREMQHRTAP